MPKVYRRKNELDACRSNQATFRAAWRSASGGIRLIYILNLEVEIKNNLAEVHPDQHMYRHVKHIFKRMRSAVESCFVKSKKGTAIEGRPAFDADKATTAVNTLLRLRALTDIMIYKEEKNDK